MTKGKGDAARTETPGTAPSATDSCPAPETLSALIDGDLPPAEAGVVRAHAEGCARCRAVAGELGALVLAARGLEHLEPPPTLWRALEGAAERSERAGGQGWQTWIDRLAWRPFATGALVGAVVVAAVFAIPAARERLAGRPAPEHAPVAAAPNHDPLLDEAESEFRRAAAAYERSIEKLRPLLERAEQGWSAAERARTKDRLARLDEAIARSRELARQTRGDSAGNEQLFIAYQQKIAFLAAAVHRGGEWREAAP
jgi:hypothetical protein